MKRVRFALALSTAIVAAAALPALAADPDPTGHVPDSVDLPVDVSIDIVHDAGDVSGSIDVHVQTNGVDRTTHVDLPPLHGGDHAGTPNDHAADRAFDAVAGPEGPDDHANGNAFDHPDGDAPEGDSQGVEEAGGAPEDLPGDQPTFTPPPDAPEDLPGDQPDFTVPPNAPEDLPGDQPDFAVPPDAPEDLPGDQPDFTVPVDAPTELPADLPSDLPEEVPTVPPAGPLGN